MAYRYLFVGTMLTTTGNFMQMVAQGWPIYHLTSSPTWLGIVSFARGLPMLILALVAGVVVDRFDRHTVLIAAQGLTALIAVILALLIATGLVLPRHVAVTAFLSDHRRRASWQAGWARRSWRPVRACWPALW